MSDPTAPPADRLPRTANATADYCTNCDTLLGTPGLHILTVAEAADHLDLIVETTARTLTCPTCGATAVGHGRTTVELVDAPCFAFPVILHWRKRRLVCPNTDCPMSTFSEADSIADAVAPPRCRLTCRAVFWAIERLRRDHASINALTRQLGVNWHTVWDPVSAVLEYFDDNDSRYDGVTEIGVDEHIWHHRQPRTRGPKEITGMVDITRDDQGKLMTRLLDLVPGRSGPVYARWIDERGPGFAAAVKVAALDPFQGYRHAIDEKYPGAEVVVDHFHLVKLAMDCVDSVRRRVQRTLTGGRGRREDPMYQMRRLLTCNTWDRSPYEKWLDKLDAVLTDERHLELQVAWKACMRLRRALADRDADQIRSSVATMPGCPIQEVARLGKTLRRWIEPIVAYCATGRSSGAVEAVNNLIELHRRIARGFRNFDNYRLRMVLIGGGFDERSGSGDTP